MLCHMWVFFHLHVDVVTKYFIDCNCNSCWKVHCRMCTELKKLLERILRIFPLIEAARPRSSSGIQSLCSLNSAIDKAKQLLQHCSESSKLYLVSISFLLFQLDKVLDIWICINYISNSGVGLPFLLHESSRFWKQIISRFCIAWEFCKYLVISLSHVEKYWATKVTYNLVKLFCCHAAC